MENLAIRQLEDAIINTLNEINLPIEVKRLVLSDVYNKVVKESDKQIAKEVAELAESTQ